MDGLYWRRSMITNIRSGNTNCYLLTQEQREKAVLIDAGTPLDGAFLERLQATGDVSNIGLLLLTHGHYDHVGYAAELQNTFHIPVAMHRKEIEKVTHGTMDFPPARGRMSSLIRRSALREMDRAHDQSFTPDIVLDTQRTLPGFPEIEIVYLPGHTQGSIGVVFEDNLFAGDLVMNLPIPSRAWFAEDFSELRRSVDLVSQIEFARIYPGHGRSFSGKWMRHLF